MFSYKSKIYLANVLYVLSDFCIFLYTLIKAYRFICYIKIVFDQLPMFNPYEWPLSIIRKLTTPYFKMWTKILPSLRLGRYPYDISHVIALEVLSSILKYIYHFKLYILLQAHALSKSSL